MARSVNLGQMYFMISPTAMGSITTQRILSNIPTTSTFTLLPAKAHVRIGVSSGASRVETPVIPTERARSPFAR